MAGWSCEGIESVQKQNAWIGFAFDKLSDLFELQVFYFLEKANFSRVYQHWMGVSGSQRRYSGLIYLEGTLWNSLFCSTPRLVYSLQLFLFKLTNGRNALPLRSLMAYKLCHNVLTFLFRAAFTGPAVKLSMLI